MESELFGHKRGSFTGAVSDKPGLFEVASGGTLFLDEVGELPVSLQSKLLRALQEKSIRRVGGVDNIKVDVRIIAATNKNLETAIVQGSFREDLYYRLNVIQIKAPPLRHRKEDIPLLAEHFLKKYMEKFGTTITGFQPQVLDALMNYSWPGNVRELENFIERAFTLESGKKISLGSLPQSVLMQYEEAHKTPQTQKKDIEHRELHLPEVDFTKGGIKLDKIIGEIERHYFQEALKYTKNRKNIAAQLLGLSFRNFRYRMAKIGLPK
ncbi:MAG: sigma-54-dependent Fis family transcriptional regulator [Deltaproteobacteria bacterium]|nr:sigma-54-dependent Fis family transcriptional regulator [Deltaproteobacteria bacterium]